MATLFFIVTHFLLAVNFANGQFVTLTSPQGQNFYCEQDRVSCSGRGIAILWTAPPSIPDIAPEGFSDVDTVPRSTIFENVEITLTNIEPGTPPLLTSELLFSNVSEINVTCQTNIVGSLQARTLIRSTTPTTAVEDHQLFYINNTSFRSNWTAPKGNFDIMHYVVQAFINDTVVYLANTTNTYVDVPLPLQRPLSSFERIFITVDFMTRCNEVGVKSDVILYIREIKNDCVIIKNDVVIIIVIVIAIVLGVICLVLLVLLTWIFCKHYEFDRSKCQCRRRTVPSPTEQK